MKVLILLAWYGLSNLLLTRIPGSTGTSVIKTHSEWHFKKYHWERMKETKTTRLGSVTWQPLTWVMLVNICSDILSHRRATSWRTSSFRSWPSTRRVWCCSNSKRLLLEKDFIFNSVSSSTATWVNSYQCGRKEKVKKNPTELRTLKTDRKLVWNVYMENQSVFITALVIIAKNWKQISFDKRMNKLWCIYYVVAVEINELDLHRYQYNPKNTTEWKR